MQPCKYFLKGNCKFGVKCALAHVLPDGKRLNTSSTSHLTLRSNKQPLRTNSGSHSSPSNVSSEPINIANEPQYQGYNEFTSAPNDQFAAANINLVAPQQYLHDYSQQQQHLLYQQHQQQQQFYSKNLSTTENPIIDTSVTEYGYPVFNNSYMSSPPSTLPLSAATTYTQSSPTFSYGNSIWSNSLNVPSISNTSTSNVGYNPLFNSPSELMYSPTSSSNMILPSSNYQNTTNSLIDSEFDDDTEDIDFIPNSLVDLLTPQELHRRKSRASFGSQAQFIGMPSLKELTLAEEETTFIMD